ncbi:MAG TPA: universal stress protein [Ktedonobacteraceae bacterium]|nr:universal stress protein [Ktedonobacteraceae bacterium]
MFKRIFVPLDGSTRAEQSIPVAARLARASKGSVMLAQVTDIPILYESYGASLYTEEVVDAQIKEVEDYLKTMVQSPLLEGVKVETSTLFGATAQTLLSMSAMFKADLVVMTSQGKTGMKRWVLGSVAQKIARHSPIPVLVIHEAGAVPVGPRPDSSPLRALVTLDGSVLAKVALEPAAQLLAALSPDTPGVLHLLRIVKTPPLNVKENDPQSIAHMQDQALQKAKMYMRSIVEHLHAGPIGKLKLAITWSVALNDDVAETIMRVAEGGEDAEGAGMPGRCDIIAMATHGRTGLQHWVLGSVTERVLSATRLPMLIVRPEETAFQTASEEKVVAPHAL